MTTTTNTKYFLCVEDPTVRIICAFRVIASSFLFSQYGSEPFGVCKHAIAIYVETMEGDNSNITINTNTNYSNRYQNSRRSKMPYSGRENTQRS